ncbi:ribonuclease P protein component [Patescibacteria group bacterium]|nr:ribonuclease P protein component [Patescibacteria group bacterium]
MLPKTNRITKQKEFDRFFGKNFHQVRGINLSSSHLILKYYPNNRTVSRFGLLVSNKIDKRATARNRIKRQLRESIHLNLPNFKTNIDALIIAKPSIKNVESVDLRKELLNIFRKVKGYDYKSV